MGRLFVVALVAACAAARAEAAPPPGATFQYAFERTVDGISGEYAGYHDTLRSSGTYQILSVDGDFARVRGVYAWAYSSSEGKYENGQENRDVTFRISDRRYVGGRTDLDEWDDKDASQLAVWFWIPPEVPDGAAVQILDEPYVVVSHDENFMVDGQYVKAIKLFHEGVHPRNDDYGVFVFSYADTYYFDPTTGMVIGETYEEHDQGTYHDMAATFQLTEKLDAGRTNYPLTVSWMATVVLYALVIGAPLGGLAFLVLLVGWFRRLPTHVDVAGIGRVTVRLVGPAKMPLPLLCPGTTTHFAPFVNDFAHKAHLAKDRVATATNYLGELVGVGTLSREATIATILTPHTEIAEELRKHLRAMDFFSEVRHPVPQRIRDEFQQAGVPLPTENAYNAFESYQVLAVAPPPALAYDTVTVSRMKVEDLPIVDDIARRVYKVSSSRWLRAQLDGGDFGFVARVNGTIVGFALASLPGTDGRVHTSTVLPEHRGKGLGKELMRARLRVLSDLGAVRVITEIADWNLASQQIARSSGFESVGTMVVETARTQRIAKAIVRR